VEVSEQPDLAVRPPQQGRTQAAWERILDAGLAILEESGYAGFTIAAICGRAGVSPPAIYARVRTKQALYFAVFEHGFAPLRARQVEALDPVRWADATAEEAARGAIAAIAWTSLAHEPFLREVARRAEEDPEVAARTHDARQWTAELFTGLMLQHPDELRSPDPEQVRACFRVVFAALMARIALPRALDVGPQVDDAAFVAHLQETAVRWLFPDARG